MSTEICKIIIESGFFFLAYQKPYYPHRRARWGSRMFLRGAEGTDWDTEALRYRDFIRYSQNYYTQVDRLRYWTLPEPLLDQREGDMDWGGATCLWDNGGELWPGDIPETAPVHINWTGAHYRGCQDENRPLPPSVAYRYKRVTPTLGGRGFYGYLRCIERGWAPLAGPLGGERLPFFVPTEWMAGLHQQQMTEPLNRSGAVQWHEDGNPVREVVISHRGGATAVHEVAGYAVGIVTTTARNFSLPVVQ